MSNSEKRPTFSIVIAVHDQAQEIAQNLPVLLTQQYGNGDDYEVIVVDESSTDETADVLKQLKTQYSHLYTTFLPKYQFQKNRRRLALTIGVKAARKEWLIFVDISTPPPSDLWLEELSQSAYAPTALMLGYINRKKGTVRLQTFDDIEKARHIISKTERARTHGHDGQWLRYLRGRYDFVVVGTNMGHDTLRLFEVKGKDYKQDI